MKPLRLSGAKQLAISVSLISVKTFKRRLITSLSPYFLAIMVTVVGSGGVSAQVQNPSMPPGAINVENSSRRAPPPPPPTPASGPKVKWSDEIQNWLDKKQAAESAHAKTVSAASKFDEALEKFTGKPLPKYSPEAQKAIREFAATEAGKELMKEFIDAWNAEMKAKGAEREAGINIDDATKAKVLQAEKEGGPDAEKKAKIEKALAEWQQNLKEDAKLLPKTMAESDKAWADFLKEINSKLASDPAIPEIEKAILEQEKAKAKAEKEKPK
jgi:hypothetical protein